MPLFAFWLASIALWVMALPLTARVFRRFPDAGAGLAFPFGLVLVGYAYFLLRVAGVLERGRGGYVIAAGLILLFGLWAIGRDPRILPTLRRARFGILASLMVFSIVFCGFALYRSYLPGIWQTEQPMDVMYLNATITSEAYPPHDPWLAGEEASYYYFGYLQAGVLTELGGVSSTTGYNLALAWTFGASAVAIASVAAALARWALGGGRQHWPVVASGAAILLLLGAGSLAGVFELTAAHEQYDREIYEAVGLETLLPCHEGETSDCYLGPSPRTTAWYPTEFWFWFRDTRIIPGTIIEFPVFSFLLGDLHPHLMAIPLVILATGVAPQGPHYNRCPRDHLRRTSVPERLGPTHLQWPLCGCGCGREHSDPGTNGPARCDWLSCASLHTGNSPVFAVVPDLQFPSRGAVRIHRRGNEARPRVPAIRNAPDRIRSHADMGDSVLAPIDVASDAGGRCDGRCRPTCGVGSVDPSILGSRGELGTGPSQCRIL